MCRCTYLLRIHESSEISRCTTFWQVDQRLAAILAICGMRAWMLHSCCARPAEVNAGRFMALEYQGSSRLLGSDRQLKSPGELHVPNLIHLDWCGQLSFIRKRGMKSAGFPKKRERVSDGACSGYRWGNLSACRTRGRWQRCPPAFGSCASEAAMEFSECSTTRDPRPVSWSFMPSRRGLSGPQPSRSNWPENV